MLPLGQRPLTGSAPDTALFVDREAQLEAAARGLRLGLNVAVFGETGSGRTSFLHQLQRRLERPSAYVEGRAWPEPRGLVLVIRAGLGDESRFTASSESRVGVQQALEEAGWAHRGDQRPRLAEWEVQLLVEAAAAGDAAGDRPEVICLDEPAPPAAELLFGAFRDTLWDAPLLWVVAAGDDARSVLLQPPAGAFFGAVVELGELSQEDAAELLRRRAGAAAGAEEGQRLERLAVEIARTVARRQPRALLEAAASALQAADPHRALAELAHARAKAAATGRTEAMLYEELRQRGPVHAGDEELLRRLGVTRPRAVQALQRLEELGLVAGHREGRRKLYRALTPESGR